MAIKPLPPQSTLLQLLRYDPEAGKLYWRPRPVSLFSSGKQPATQNAAVWNSKHAGKEAFNTLMANGRLCGRINYTTFLAHRVVWKMVHGGDPSEIDHIDGDPANNRISNLRCVTHAENGQNERKRKNNTSGVMGVGWYADRRKWYAHINVDSRRIHLGYFDIFDEAVAAREAAEVQYGFHPNHGRN